MIRLFTALEIPDRVREQLLRLQFGVPNAYWKTKEQLHLTLRFIGELDEPQAHDVDDALSTIRAPAFEMELAGAGEFGGKKPRILWAGVRPNNAIMHLQKKIEAALQRLGLPAETRKFTPHVTLATVKSTPPGLVMDFLTDHALFASGPFKVEQFVLYSSHLGANGSIYNAERTYALTH